MTLDKTITGTHQSADDPNGITIEDVDVPQDETWYIDEFKLIQDGTGASAGTNIYFAVLPRDYINEKGRDAETDPEWVDIVQSKGEVIESQGDQAEINTANIDEYVSDDETILLFEWDGSSGNWTGNYTITMRRIL